MDAVSVISQENLIDNPNSTGSLPLSPTSGFESSINRPMVSTQPPDPHVPETQRQNPTMFYQAHNFTATGTFIQSNVTHNVATSDRFIEKLLEKTILGAASDFSARDPPPRCHPGTRLAILQYCLNFITNRGGKKMLWVFGAAEVGKSAIMQTVAESLPLETVSSYASVFFSIQGRNDGTKTIMIISYQLAAKSESYRRLIEQEITRDPSFLQSSMHPSSPLIWLIANRPETHITSFFSKRHILPVYEKKEILVDSQQAREDVELLLRYELREVKELFNLHSKWPKERDLWKLADASGGLFAYADTAMKYIGDLAVGNPASQLTDILSVIDNHPAIHLTREQHPMALLDALYARILSNVSPKIMVNSRKLLLTLASPRDLISYFYEASFMVLCNWLGLTYDDAYAAVNHLRSVLLVPRRDNAHNEELKCFHKSFIDYISDFTRSGFSPDPKREAPEFDIQRTFAILKESPDNIDFGDADYVSVFGDLRRGSGASDKISLTWPVDNEISDWDDNRTRLNLYKRATGCSRN